MTIITDRVDSDGIITIDSAKCSGCGTCVAVCKDLSLKLADGKVTINQEPIFGCIACGHCAAVCPNNAIMVEGRTLSSRDFIQIPSKEEKTSYRELYSLVLARRSVRDFQDREVEPDIIDKSFSYQLQHPWVSIQR